MIKRPVEEVGGLTMLGRRDVRVVLHRDGASGRVAEEPLGDLGSGAGGSEQASPRAQLPANSYCNPSHKVVLLTLYRGP